MAGRIKETFTVQVDRPQQQVFDYIADISRHAEWSPKPYRVEDVKEVPGRVGTTFTSFGWIPGDKEHRNDCEVTASNPPDTFVITSRERGEEFINTFQLTPQNGGTKVVREMDMPKPGGALGLVFPVIIKVVARPGVQKGMNMLKDNLER